MDIQKYIASGVLEQYVLGQLSAAECSEVEANAVQYPAIKAEIEAIEMAFEQYGQANAIEPSPGLEAKIFDKIGSPKVDTSPAPPSPDNSSGLFSRTITMLAVAASLAVLFWGYTLRSELQTTRQALQEAQANYETLQTDCSQQLIQKEKAETYIAFLRDRDTRPVELAGTEKAPDAVAAVFWNAEQKKSYLEITSLPPVPTGKQYQLWAIVDGTPVDMGVFDVTIGPDGYIEIPHIDQPQAFAVTLEKAGGNPTPTLSEMVVIGNVG